MSPYIELQECQHRLPLSSNVFMYRLVQLVESATLVNYTCLDGFEMKGRCMSSITSGVVGIHVHFSSMQTAGIRIL